MVEIELYWCKNEENRTKWEKICKKMSLNHNGYVVVL